jgi:hypothetical protein
MIAYDTEKEYSNAIQKLKDNGQRVQSEIKRLKL